MPRPSKATVPGIGTERVPHSNLRSLFGNLPKTSGLTGTATPNVYDAEGRLCATPIGSGGYEGYVYDAAGNRVAKGTLGSPSCDFSPNSLTGKPDNGFVLTSRYLLGPSGEQMTELNGAGQWVHTNVTANGSLIATFDINSSSIERISLACLASRKGSPRRILSVLRHDS